MRTSLYVWLASVTLGVVCSGALAQQREATPLGLPRAPAGERPAPEHAAGGAGSAASWSRVVLACGGVVLLICGVGWVVRRTAGRAGLIGQLGAGGRAPSGVLEVLGRYPVGRSCTLVLLKLDSRVLLVSHSWGRGGVGMQTLCEVTDPEQVASLLVKTRDEEGSTLARQFQAVLSREHVAFDRAERQPLATHPGNPATPTNAPGAPRAGARPDTVRAATKATPVRGSEAATAIRDRLASMRARPGVEVRA